MNFEGAEFRRDSFGGGDNEGCGVADDAFAECHDADACLFGAALGLDGCCNAVGAILELAGGDCETVLASVWDTFAPLSLTPSGRSTTTRSTPTAGATHLPLGHHVPIRSTMARRPSPDRRLERRRASAALFAALIDDAGLLSPASKPAAQAIGDPAHQCRVALMDNRPTTHARNQTTVQPSAPATSSPPGRSPATARQVRQADQTQVRRQGLAVETIRATQCAEGFT
jgi:hypothetical protein